MGKFKKGQSGNPNGRPKGAPNKLTKQKKAQLLKIDMDYVNSDLFMKDWLSLEPWQRQSLHYKRLEYLMPKQQRITNEIDLSKLSEQEVEELIDRILSRMD